MEGAIINTTFKDLKQHQLMAKQLASKIHANGKVLEIAWGLGYFCNQISPG